MPNPIMLSSKIPSSAKPRSTSRDSIRLASVVGGVVWNGLASDMTPPSFASLAFKALDVVIGEQV